MLPIEKTRRFDGIFPRNMFKWSGRNIEAGDGRTRMKAAKRIWDIFTTLLVIAAVVLAIALVGVRLVGLQPFTVLSGSMEPTYHTGSLIYVKKVDYRTLEVGDAITFMLDESTVATHRIVGIVPDEEDPEVVRYRTKGDANEAEDGGLVHYKNVIGKPVVTIPKLGYIASYVQNPPGTYVAVSAGAFIVLLMFLPELLRSIFSDGGEEKSAPREETEPPMKKERERSRRAVTGREETRRAAPAAEEDERRASRGSHRKKGRHEL